MQRGTVVTFVPKRNTILIIIADHRRSLAGLDLVWRKNTVPASALEPNLGVPETSINHVEGMDRVVIELQILGKMSGVTDLCS